MFQLQQQEGQQNSNRGEDASTLITSQAELCTISKPENWQNRKRVGAISF
jgi:hypothetical protein